MQAQHSSEGEKSKKKTDKIPLHQPVPKPVELGIAKEFIDLLLEHDVSSLRSSTTCKLWVKIATWRFLRKEVRPSAGSSKCERCSSAEPVFLTVRAWGKYTCSFANSREKAVSKLAFGFALKDLPGATRNSRGGLLCQSAHNQPRKRRRAKNARISLAHEDRRWPQGPGGSPQEGTPSALHPSKTGLEYPRQARLVQKAQFDAVYRAGKRRSSSHFTAFLKANNLPQSRFGFSIKKALGGRGCAQSNPAPLARNRAGCTGRSLPAGWDIVIHPKSSVAKAPFAMLETDFPSASEKPVRTRRAAVRAALIALRCYKSVFSPRSFAGSWPV